MTMDVDVVVELEDDEDVTLEEGTRELAAKFDSDESGWISVFIT